MCTILQARAYYNEFFKDVRSCMVKDYIKPFYIPSAYKELQFAAYLLVGQQSLATPVQFPAHEGIKPPGSPIHDWRFNDYFFLYADNKSFGEIPDNFRGFKQLSGFVAEYCIINTRGLERITDPTQLIKHITKEENMKVENIKVEQELSVKTPKMKPRTNDRLVFTYTNGATYTVRGLGNARIHGMNIIYVSKVEDAEGNVTVSEVRRRITNDFSTVVIEKADGRQYMLLDLRSESAKKSEEKSTKPPRKRKSRDEYEAEQAQKEAEKAKLAKVEELLDKAAELLK